MALSVLLAVDSLKAAVPCSLLSASMLPFASLSLGIGSISWFVPKKTFLALDNTLYKAYMRLCLFVFENVSGVQLKLYGDLDLLKTKSESALVLSNHQTNVDWAIIMMLADRQGENGSSVGFRVMVKNAIHYVPLFGWYIFQHGYIYVRRFGTFIGTPVLKQLKWLDSIGECYWLLVFPEGTRFTKRHPEKIKQSQEFCEESGLKVLENVLCPRVGGMHMAVENLTSLDAIYDITIGYGQTRKVNRRGYAPGMFEFVCGSPEGRYVAVHIKRHSITDVPKDKGELKNWMMTLYGAKDKLMEEFYATGEFPDKKDEREPALSIKRTLPATLFFGGALLSAYYLPFVRNVYKSSFDDIDRLDCLGVDIKGCLEAIKPLSANDGKCLKTARELLTNTLCLNDNSNTFTRCTTIVTCLKIIQETGDNDDLIQAIEDTADCYRNNPLFFQIVLLERMRTSQFFLIPTLFATRFHAVDDSFPRHLLFDNTFTYKKLFKICNYHLLGFGENTYYNYGVPTKGATKRAHQIGFRDTEITKVSMSNQHTLFLDSNNQVHGCGSSSKGQLGFVSGTIAVTPSLIELPDLGNEIVIDILAMEGFSIILTQRSIYICGDYKKIVPDSNNFQIKKYVLFESIDCYDMTITANTDYICIYALKLVFLCGFLSDEYTPPFMKYCRDTFINQNYNYIKNKGYKRSDSFDQNNFDAKNIDHRYQALPSFETNSGNHRRVALQYSRGQRYEFLFCIMSPLVYSNPDLISQHRTFEIYLKSGETVPHVFLLNGFRVHLNIWQFEVSKEGDIIVLAQTYKSQMDDSNGSMGACLYRGTFSLRKRKTRFDQEFIFAAPKNDVEALMRKSYWEIYLEEIMNSHGATFLSASPDLKNIIYKVEADQSFNDNDWGQLKWRSMNFQYLRSIQKEEIEESQDIVKVVSKENVDFTTTIEMIGYRVPALLPFVRNGVLDFSEAAKVLELSEECHAIYRFLAGFPFSQSFYEKLRRNVSVRPGPLLKTIGQCGITIRKQGQSSIRLYNTGDAGDVVPNDCTLISADGLRFQSNQKWLRLHSHYISLALNYSSENTLSLDYSGAIIQRVLNFLERPELLLDCSFDEIYQVFGFCDQYMFEALTQDCLQALFYRATHVNCEELFNFYFTLPSFHDLIVNLFLDRIDLLCFYPNSALAPIDLLREIEPLVETSANPSCAINALALDQNFTCKHDDFSMVLVTDETFRKTLKGNTKNQKIKKEVDEIVKCCASSGFLEFTLKSSLIFYEFDSHYTDQVCADFLEKYKRAQEKVLASKAKSPKDKKKKKDSCSPMEPPPSLPRPFPDPRVTLEQHFPTSPCVTDTQSTSSETTNTLPKPAEVTQITSPCLLPEPGLERNCTSLAMLVLDDEDVSTPKETKSPFLEKIQKVMKPKLKPMGKGHKADHLLLEKIPNGAPWAKASSPGPSTSLAIIQAEELERELHQVPENPEPRSRRAVWKSESEEGSHNLSFSQIMHEEKVKTEDEKKKFSRPLAFIEEEEKAAKELQQLYEQNVGDEMMVSVDFEKEQQKDPVWVSSISRRF